MGLRQQGDLSKDGKVGLLLVSAASSLVIVAVA